MHFIQKIKRIGDICWDDDAAAAASAIIASFWKAHGDMVQAFLVWMSLI